MKKYWILGIMIILIAIGFILGLSGYEVAAAREFAVGYFSAGRFSAGIFSAGIFSVGVFSAGIFSIGIFSIGIFNIGVFATGFFLWAWRKKYARANLAPDCEEQAEVAS
jgi:hypothetical protein